MAVFPRLRPRSGSALPGFGLTLGFTIAYLSSIVLIPLSTAFWEAFSQGGERFWRTVSDERVVTALRLSFGTAFAAALVNGLFGLLTAWVLTRYQFPGRKFLNGLVDLPFALPTAVAGITLTTIYAPTGWIGQYLEPRGVTVVYTPLGIVVALIFTGLPFVVRTVQPVLEDLDPEIEEAAVLLGASPLQTFRRVLLPALLPALVTGCTLAFARAVGEYGSVIFISGNMPMRTEIAPLLIMSKLDEFDYPGATAVAVAMLVLSFGLLLLINLLQFWTVRRGGETRLKRREAPL